MKLGLYRMCLYFSEFDLAIALSTGRNPAHIAVLRQDVIYWKSLVDREVINCKGA